MPTGGAQTLGLYVALQMMWNPRADVDVVGRRVLHALLCRSGCAHATTLPTVLTKPNAAFGDVAAVVP